MSKEPDDRPIITSEWYPRESDESCLVVEDAELLDDTGLHRATIRVRTPDGLGPPTTVVFKIVPLAD